MIILEKNQIFDGILTNDHRVFGIEIRPIGLFGEVGNQFYDEPDIDGPIHCWSAYALLRDAGCDCIGDFISRDDAIAYAAQVAEKLKLSLFVE